MRLSFFFSGIEMTNKLAPVSIVGIRSRFDEKSLTFSIGMGICMGMYISSP